MSKLKGNGGDSLMVSYYSNIDSLALRYTPFFDKLLDVPSKQALVFHCTAGKDRTGIAAALLLYALGVPYDTIVKDYEATNFYRKGENDKATAQIVKMHIDENVAKSMMGARREYLDATFAAITKQYGSVDNYLKTQIGLDDQKIAVLKKKFLE
jgi:protein-tyrosine phosphatase